jgi:hypothetical protein
LSEKNYIKIMLFVYNYLINLLVIINYLINNLLIQETLNNFLDNIFHFFNYYLLQSLNSFSRLAIEV